MDFRFTGEQEQLRATVRELLARHCRPADVRRAMADPAGHDPGLWRRLAGDLGLVALAVPERHGGLGATTVELAIALDECGAALAPVPLLSSATAALALLAAGPSDTAAALLPRVAAGEVVATVALAESGSWAADTVRCTASRRAGEWRLDGRKEHVLDGQLADWLVVAARTDGAVRLFAVDARAGGVRCLPLTTVDPTRGQAHVEFVDAPAEPLGDAPDALARTVDLVGVALAAEAVGGARRCLADTVGYLTQRVQFGQPIGSFQALQHRAADVAVAVEAATATAYYAAWAATAAPDELPVVGPLAKSWCSEVFVHAAAEMIQLHGGIGFTWEHDAHLLYKRAKASEQLFGSPHVLRRVVAERAGLSASAPAAR